MASFFITDRPDHDWTGPNCWQNVGIYKYRRYSRAGHPLAQGEFDRRRAEGRSAAMWRCDKDGGPFILVDQC